MTSLGTQLITTTRKLILVKVVVSSLPIYQASFLLAIKMIIEQPSKLIRNFPCQGGKGNTKKSLSKLAHCEKATIRRQTSGKRPRVSQSSFGRKDSLENLLKSLSSCKSSSH